MVLFNYSTKELTAKVVYYGPGLCGKTTNLQWIHEKLPIRNKGKMLSLATETDRTLFFDFLPIELGTIRGMKTRIQLYTVPGQVFYNATRRMVLKGADCVVFVCDSQEPMLDANLESLENLRQNLEANEIDSDELPMVLQYNKRDLPNALPIEILNERLNPNSGPFFEAVAIKGQGVEETLKGVTQLVFRSLAGRYGGADTPTPGTHTPAPVAKPAPPPPPPPPPRPAAPPVSPLPPLRMEAAPASTDALLDSLELQPAPDDLLPASPELGLDMGPPPAAGEPEVIETLEVEEELPAPPLPPAAPPAGRTTLVSGPKEAEDLRRKIARPSIPDLALEEEEDEEEIDELALESEPAPAMADEVTAPVVPPPRPAPPLRPAVPEPVPVIEVPPVAVHVPATASGTDVAIPVEVSVVDGTAQVSIQIRLTLSLKIER